jgi:hypothetical protein
MSFSKLALQWAALIFFSLSLSWVLTWAEFPAALLLGPMLCGVAVGLRGASIRLPRWAFTGAQAVIGCQVAQAITVSILLSIAHDWLVMLAVVGTTIAAGGVVGWVLTRYGALPGNTAAWGSSPGGAAAMTAMSEEYGADARLVAFMQYLRVFIVVLTASAVSRVLIGSQPTAAGSPAPLIDLGLDSPLIPVLETLAVILAGPLIGLKLRIPAGAMLVPLVMGSILNSSGTVSINVPHWLSGSAYACLGWYIGLRFTRGVVLHVYRAIPQLLLSTFLLIGLCCISALALNHLLGISGLTAYLATSPGGLDSIAIIAMGSDSDAAFVLSMQTLRLFAVILTGPYIARLVCRFAAPCEKPGPADGKKI